MANKGALSVEELADISQNELNAKYNYGPGKPGNSFGRQANLKSAAYAKNIIDQGVNDIEAISDAIHEGWNVTAQAFVENPYQFNDTKALQEAGNLDKKLEQRKKLMMTKYADLPDDEKEKDRVVARVLLQAIRPHTYKKGVVFPRIQALELFPEPNYDDAHPYERMLDDLPQQYGQGQRGWGGKFARKSARKASRKPSRKSSRKAKKSSRKYRKVSRR